MAVKPKPSDVWPSDRRPRRAFGRDHVRVARESFTFISQRLGATLLVWVLIGIALALPTALYLTERNLAAVAGEWQENLGFSIYFQPGVAAEAPAALARRLRREPDVDRARLITPEQALLEFRRHAAISDALDLLDDNPLPATIRVAVAADVPAARLTLLADHARRSEGVDEVVVERAWLERLATIREVVDRIYQVAAVLLGIGAVLVSSASVRLAIEARLDELQVLALVGASKRFMRRPFLYLGVIYGVCGALVAAMLVSMALIWLEAPLTRLFGSYGRGLELVRFDPMMFLALLASGTLLGWLGARIASDQRLRELAV